MIASLLMRTIYVEKMGTGILRINSSLTHHGLPKAEFEFDENNFAIIIKDNTDKVTDRGTDEVTDNQQRIIELISNNNKISLSEIAEIIGISKRKVVDNTNKLKVKGILERIGSPKVRALEREEIIV